MARQPKPRIKTIGKSTYWFTKAGGDAYFGSVEDVKHQDAKKLFAEHLVRIGTEGERNKKRWLAAGELMDLFLE